MTTLRQHTLHALPVRDCDRFTMIDRYAVCSNLRQIRDPDIREVRHTHTEKERRRMILRAVYLSLHLEESGHIACIICAERKTYG